MKDISGTQKSGGSRLPTGDTFKFNCHAGVACFNGDEFKKFIFESTFLSRFDVPLKTVGRFKESDVELMKFGFDWVKFFLTGTGPLGVAR